MIQMDDHDGSLSRAHEARDSRSARRRAVLDHAGAACLGIFAAGYFYFAYLFISAIL